MLHEVTWEMFSSSSDDISEFKDMVLIFISVLVYSTGHHQGTSTSYRGNPLHVNCGDSSLRNDLNTFFTRSNGNSYMVKMWLHVPVKPKASLRANQSVWLWSQSIRSTCLWPVSGRKAASLGRISENILRCFHVPFLQWVFK